MKTKYYILIIAILFIATGYGWQLFKPGCVFEKTGEIVILEDNQGPMTLTWFLWRITAVIEYLMWSISVIIIALNQKVRNYRYGLVVMAIILSVIYAMDIIQIGFTGCNDYFVGFEISLIVIYAMVCFLTLFGENTLKKLKLTATLNKLKTKALYLANNTNKQERNHTEQLNQTLELLLAKAQIEDQNHTRKQMVKAHDLMDTYIGAIKDITTNYEKLGNENSLQLINKMVDSAIRLNTKMYQTQNT